MTGDSKYKEPEAKPEIETGAADARAAETSRRSPVSNMDMQAFRNFLMRALSGDQDVPPSILTRVNETAREHGSDAKKRDTEWWERYFWRQAILDNLGRIRELIETKRAERDQLLADIRDDETLLGTFDRHRRGYERAKNYRDLHGEYELKENGELGDDDAENMLKAWEKRTGRKLDRKNTKDIQDAFDDQRKNEESEAQRIQRELEIRRERLRKIEEEIRELESAEAKAEAALEDGADLQPINSDLQRELIAKGHGTEEQKRKLAEEQGLSLPLEQFTKANDDEFDEPSIKPAFNQTASASQPKAPEIVQENAAENNSPVKKPAMNLSV